MYYLWPIATLRPQVMRASEFLDSMHMLSNQVDELRGSPLSVGTLEEIIDEK